MARDKVIDVFVVICFALVVTWASLATARINRMEYEVSNLKAWKATIEVYYRP